MLRYQLQIWDKIAWWAVIDNGKRSTLKTSGEIALNGVDRLAKKKGALGDIPNIPPALSIT
jgi:hypothetical protein